MKIAIMQPYFFPYLGYFDLINNVDLFIIYDTVQYIQQGWINRNRILHPSRSGWQYITVPLKKASFHQSYRTPIRDIMISDTIDWKPHMIAQLAHYETSSPHASDVIEFVKNCLQSNEPSISKLNVHILEQITDLLGMKFEYQYSSELKIELDKTRTPQERVLDLCESLGAKEYVNLPGGVDLYDPQVFKERDINLVFRKLPTFLYQTSDYTFEPNLSIVDILMWNKPHTVRMFLQDNQSEWKNQRLDKNLS